MKDFGYFFTSGEFFEVLLIVLLVVLLLQFIKRVLIKKIAYNDGKKGHRNTFLGIVFNALQYVVVLLGLFAILSVFKINITGMLAGLGVVATIVGLSLQDTFKDLFAGINIYSNNFYKVGDYVKYNGEICEVKFFNARISKFRSIFTNATHTVSNSTIYNIEKVKDIFVFQYIFDFEDNKKKVLKAIENVKAACENEKGVKEIINLGIINISEKGVHYGLLVKVPPKDYLPVSMKVSDCAYDEFMKAKVVPSFDQDVMIKKEPKI